MTVSSPSGFDAAGSCERRQVELEPRCYHEDQHNAATLVTPEHYDLSERELASKVAVVTGSSQGIGRAIALELARAGASVITHAGVHAEKAAEVANEIKELGVDAASLVADIAQPDACTKLVEDSFRWRGVVDIWINNAGADILTGAAREMDWEAKLQRVWEVDVAGTMRLSREAGKRMIAASFKQPSAKQADYAILNMGWDQARFGMGGDSGEMFAASKGAIMAFTRSLAISLAPHVRVNCLAPGWIRTAWGQAAPEPWRQRAIGESLLERWGEPDDVAKVARFLASPAASFVNGQIVPINGGFRHGR
jgi:3-oxoacyl-[acyl-carrier protein] reductase